MQSDKKEAPGSGSQDRLEEYRALTRSLAGEGDALDVLRDVAEKVRAATEALAVQIERVSGPDAAGVVVVSAGVPGDPDQRRRNLDGANRIVIALGRRNERIGSIVLFRPEHSPPVDSATLERVSDLATLATLSLGLSALNATVRDTRDECRRIVEDKYRLISGVGEELKERLGVASEYVQLLDTEGELTEREQHYIERSRQSIDAVVRIIRDLVQLSRIDTGNLAVRPEPTNLPVLLRGIVRDFQLSVGTIGLEFDVSVPGDLPLISTDIDYVRQILDTLLSNAIRYSPVGGRVTVRADIRPGRRKSDPLRYLCIEVADAGPGIGDQDLIFEEVYRIERRGENAGFRLAIARRMARLLGGELTLETEAGTGSTFTLWLPDAPPDSTPSYTDLKQKTDVALLG
ncbi:MAG TPA: HAMP domain-containing sensor histidine kinase [Longimicrobiales bacterium]|nr:HAMP domain-containing sensor histidine kinase [Longimicrobiales bacterium]